MVSLNPVEPQFNTVMEEVEKCIQKSEYSLKNSIYSDDQKSLFIYCFTFNLWVQQQQVGVLK